MPPTPAPQHHTASVAAVLRGEGGWCKLPLTTIPSVGREVPGSSIVPELRARKGWDSISEMLSQSDFIDFKPFPPNHVTSSHVVPFQDVRLWRIVCLSAHLALSLGPVPRLPGLDPHFTFLHPFPIPNPQYNPFPNPFLSLVLSILLSVVGYFATPRRQSRHLVAVTALPALPGRSPIPISTLPLSPSTLP